MNTAPMHDRHQALISQLDWLVRQPDQPAAYKQYQEWLRSQRISNEEMVAARLDYLVVRMAIAEQQPNTRAELAIVSDRLHYTPQEHQQAAQNFQRLKQPAKATRPKTNVVPINPLDLGKLPTPSDRLSDEVHSLGRKVALVAEKRGLPLAYVPDRSRKSIRVKRLFFQPAENADLTKVAALRLNLIGHAGLQPSASILVVPGGVEIHDPIPGEEWEKPHFKTYIAKEKKTDSDESIHKGNDFFVYRRKDGELIHVDQAGFVTLVPENGFAYTIGIDLDGQPILKKNVIGLLIPGYKGSGKSHHLRSLIAELSMKYHPKYLQFALFDVCGATFKDFVDSPWQWQLPCLEEKSYEGLMVNLAKEAKRREVLFRENGVGSIEEWNSTFWDKPLPRIVVCVEEFGETVYRITKSVANKVPASLSRANRKQGFDIVIATQIPQREDFDDDLLRNLADRVIFLAADMGASYISFGYNEDCAVNLQGSGDGYLKSGSNPIRFQSLFLGDHNGKALVAYLNQWGKALYGEPEPEVDDFWRDDAPTKEVEESDPAKKRYEQILQHEPKYKAEKMSETDFLWHVFQDKYPDKKTLTGSSRNWCRSEVSRLKKQFGDK